MTNQTALITGIEGQDGSYLAEHLLGLGFDVTGICRPGGSDVNIRHISDQITLETFDISDSAALQAIVRRARPDQIYHLAGPTFLGDGDADAAVKFQVIVTSTFALLEAIVEMVPQSRFFFAGSSEMFGDTDESPQLETTSFRPRSAYGLAKVCSHEIVKYFRRHRDVWCCTGFLYNHESPRRQSRFVTRKITQAAARISRNEQQSLKLGDLSARRDWGYAPDYVVALSAMLKSTEPRDYVISTGKTHSVEELLDAAFSHVDLDYTNYVETDPSFVRKEPTHQLVGNPAAILSDLGWMAKTPFETIVHAMVDVDLQLPHEKASEKDT